MTINSLGSGLISLDLVCYPLDRSTHQFPHSGTQAWVAWQKEKRSTMKVFKNPSSCTHLPSCLRRVDCQRDMCCGSCWWSSGQVVGSCLALSFDISPQAYLALSTSPSLPTAPWSDARRRREKKWEAAGNLSKWAAPPSFCSQPCPSSPPSSPPLQD